MTTTYDTFAEALESTGFETPEAALEQGVSISGVVMSETENRYFVLDADTSMDEGHAIAFEIKHGRPMSEYEQWLLDQARQRQVA